MDYSSYSDDEFGTGGRKGRGRRGRERRGKHKYGRSKSKHLIERVLKDEINELLSLVKDVDDNIEFERSRASTGRRDSGVQSKSTWRKQMMLKS